MARPAMPVSQLFSQHAERVRCHRTRRRRVHNPRSNNDQRSGSGNHTTRRAVIEPLRSPSDTFCDASLHVSMSMLPPTKSRVRKRASMGNRGRRRCMATPASVHMTWRRATSARQVPREFKTHGKCHRKRTQCHREDQEVDASHNLPHAPNGTIETYSDRNKPAEASALMRKATSKDNLNTRPGITKRHKRHHRAKQQCMNHDWLLRLD